MTSLTWDQVIAWRLRRSHLSRRSAPSKLTAVVSDMCGAHAQIMSTVGLALAARVSRLSQDTLDRAIIDAAFPGVAAAMTDPVLAQELAEFFAHAWKNENPIYRVQNKTWLNFWRAIAEPAKEPGPVPSLRQN